MQAAVAILERVNIDETERGRRRLQDRVKRALAHAFIRTQHSRRQILQVRRARADEFRQRIALMIALTKKDAVRAQAGAHKACLRSERRAAV